MTPLNLVALVTEGGAQMALVAEAGTAEEEAEVLAEGGIIFVTDLACAKGVWSSIGGAAVLIEEIGVSLEVMLSSSDAIEEE